MKDGSDVAREGHLAVGPGDPLPGARVQAGVTIATSMTSTRAAAAA